MYLPRYLRNKNNLNQNHKVQNLQTVMKYQAVNKTNSHSNYKILLNYNLKKNHTK